MKKTTVFVSLAVILSLMLSACASTRGTGGITKVTVIRDWPTFWAWQMSLEIAQAKGFYKAQNLEVTLEFPPQPADVIKLVATGKAQFGIATTSDLINATNEGLQVIGVATLTPRDMGGIMYYKDSGMTSPADLKGKTVAIYNWPQTELNFRTMLEKYNLSLNDVNKVDAGDYSVPLMVAGQVDAADAAAGGEDLNTFLQTGRETGIWLYTEHGVPPFYNFIVIVNPTFAKENPKAVTGFIQAMFEAFDYVNAHPDEAVEISLKAHPDADPEFLRRGWPMGVEPFLKPWPGDADNPRGYMDLDRIRAYAQFQFDGGLIERVPDPTTFIDLSYLPK
jgi:putative hydroxymethylpyrimidine transport system substrate-binding protein